MQEYLISVHPGRVDFSKPFAFSEGFVTAPASTPGELADVITSAVWSPCCWEWGTRLKKFFTCAGWLVLDYDDGRVTLDQAVGEWKSFTHVIGTTKSHQVRKDGEAACDRFRVCVKFAELAIGLDQYEYNQRFAVDLFDSDRKTVDGGRFFWPCTRVVSIGTGQTIRPKNPPSGPPPRGSWRSDPFKAPLRRETEYFLRFGAAHGARNDSAFRAGLDLARHGFSAQEIEDAIRRVTDLPKREIVGIVKNVMKQAPIRWTPRGPR